MRRGLIDSANVKGMTVFVPSGATSHSQINTLRYWLTAIQLMVSKDDFLKYFAVQKYGEYNMLDPRAIELTGLDEATYAEIIGNYIKYRNLYLPKRVPSFANNGAEPTSEITK